MDIGANPAPSISLHFPTIAHLSWSRDSTALRLWDDRETFYYNESLQTLAHYLDCAQVVQQCEKVLLTLSSVKHGEWLLQHCWLWLKDVTRCKLHKAKAFCIATIAAGKGKMDREEYKQGKLWWDKALQMELVEAAVKRQAKEKY